VIDIVFCADPLERRQVDEHYAGEADAAGKLGFRCHLIGFERLTEGSDPVRATARVEKTDHEQPAVYRGWMLGCPDYEALYQALVRRNLRLINSPQQYRHCHHLPESYSKIAGHTPHTVWLECSPPVDMSAVFQAIAPFADQPIIVKDYVKSQKHYWHEACFIPSASDHVAVARVVSRFIELQSGELQGGLVFRRYLELETAGTHPRSGMPLAREYRIFFLDRRPVLVLNYWDEVSYRAIEAPMDRFAELAAAIESRFFTMDVARLAGGGWVVVELGDGQVAGLPETADPVQLLQPLLAAE